MRKLLAGAVVALAGLGFTGPTMAQDALTLQLKWVTQGQFAGYYVAKEKGFYEEAGLDVTIKPGGPDIAPEQVIAGGGADVIVDWMPAALAAREKGLPLVNIAQPFKKSGMELTCRKETGIEKPEDFKGKTLGVWFSGNEYPFLSWMSKLGLSTEGGADGVTVIKQGFNVDPLIQKQADCISTMTYNEYWQVIDAGIPEGELTVFKYEDQGVATLEDGLYVLEESLNDPAMVDKLARFVKASMKGWEYAAENTDEAAGIVLDNDMTGAQTEEHQKRMVGEINKLVDGSDGTLDTASADTTVEVLMGGGSDPVITKQPEGAWSSVVTDKMKDLQ
ncbi:ABC transporter substrate-binding protein [Aurantimonas sp. C2-6-R+9]|uniref:ABC transporter substrate-binding protein n=1 Tax=unclassified Aurantimonas TaxID=2638230 RepID=UPI002E19C317|nr:MULTISPECIES: ABC transporter substrate-binding protein [unclassified Aurantimonas]MEC5291047.1 ABC transporter substrate-binding protein [Aurantimonas sp. C2-3-R2]MEC5381376.1 ABC transporter substrate-binding protein [Aurantimonas sp. C2-6-R+9]MEC5412198.1 ABC transporter substrate-binding protein [Aurantimonas sp. C2-4-R8]